MPINIFEKEILKTLGDKYSLYLIENAYQSPFGRKMAEMEKLNVL